MHICDEVAAAADAPPLAACAQFEEYALVECAL